MTVVRFCPRCHKQAAEYRFNAAGNLVFHVCVLCGYSADDYLKDLHGNEDDDKGRKKALR